MVRDMTQGSVVRHLVGFSVPLVLGSLLQMACNAVDSIIVGRFAGKNALAAVGTADPVMNLLILEVSGLCVGASALMSEAFGAKDASRVRRCFASVLYLGLGFSVRAFCVWRWTPWLGLAAVAWASLAGWLCMLFGQLPLLRRAWKRL